MSLQKSIAVAVCLLCLAFNLPAQLEAKSFLEKLSEEESCDKTNSCRSTLYENTLKHWEKRPPLNKLCKFCEALVPIVKHLIEKNDTAHFAEIVTFACEEFKIEDKTVCEYVVRTYQV